MLIKSDAMHCAKNMLYIMDLICIEMYNEVQVYNVNES